MPKRKRPRAKHPRGHRQPNRPTIARRDHHRLADDLADQPLIQGLRTALRSDDPIDLLMTVSGIVEAATQDPHVGLRGEQRERVGIDEILESFLDIDIAETTAALTVIAAWSDEVTAARIRRTLHTRRQALPPWLRQLHESRLGGTAVINDPLGDGATHLLGLELGDGTPLTVLVYLDANLSHAIKDAFAFTRSLAAAVDRMDEISEGQAPAQPSDPAQARALVERGMERWAMFLPPPQNDTWPVCRPVVRWAAGLLPGGVELPEDRIWEEAEMTALRDRFLATPGGAPYADQGLAHLVDDVIWLGTYDDGDPTRWSAVRVEILMLDRFPRKVVGEPADLTRLPDVLAAFIRFCHAERGVDPGHTENTLAAVSHHTPEFQRLIRSERPTGPAALAQMLIDQFPDDGASDLEEEVGGQSNLTNLSDEPLPDEEFEWSGVPEDVHERVREILALTDDVAKQHLDVEHRTAMRRLLSRIVVSDPAYFRGRAGARGSAAALVWMVVRANDSASYQGRPLLKELLAGLGGTAPPERVDRFRSMLGLPPRRVSVSLPFPDLLVSRHRAQLIRFRDLNLGRD